MAAQPYNQADPDKAPEALPAKKSRMPLIIMLLALAVFAGTFVAMRVLMAKGHAKKGPVKPEVGVVIGLDDFLLNTADPSGDHYVKTTIAIGLVKGKSEDEFKNKIPIVRDAIVLDLSSKNMSQLRTTPEKIALKTELTKKINQALGENDVVEVYLESFATQ